jgi:hypothetical protein
VAQRDRDEQKLWLILFQLRAIRARMNSLAAQYLVFSTLAIVILGAALVMAAALSMRPLSFLSIGAIVGLLVIIIVFHVARSALRSSASSLKAAALADTRGGLKGRLMTVLLMSDSGPGSELWRYLVEDTYGRRNEFEPAKIEPRWLSRSFFTLLTACILVFFIAQIGKLGLGGHPLRGPVMPSHVTADLGSLDIRPADPALEPNAKIYADEATLQKLADKLASQPSSAGNDRLPQWLDKARNFAGSLQKEITGQQNRPPIELSLTDREGDNSQEPRSHRPSQAPERGGGTNQQGTGKADSRSASAPKPGQAPDQVARNGVGVPGQLGNDPGQANPSDFGSPAIGRPDGGGGSSHGAGSDPEHLLGPPSSQPLGSDSFKITIDAEPSDESSASRAPAYIPPKIRAPLNDRQFEDEPIARASVPAADQTTIKRVFQR